MVFLVMYQSQYRYAIPLKYRSLNTDSCYNKIYIGSAMSWFLLPITIKVIVIRHCESDLRSYRLPPMSTQFVGAPVAFITNPILRLKLLQ